VWGKKKKEVSNARNASTVRAGVTGDGSSSWPARGRSVQELAREFEPSANAIRNWVKQTALDEGLRSDGLTTTEREELKRLRERFVTIDRYVGRARRLKDNFRISSVDHPLLPKDGRRQHGHRHAKTQRQRQS
jgi:transposase-like protein